MIRNYFAGVSKKKGHANVIPKSLYTCILLSARSSCLGSSQLLIYEITRELKSILLNFRVQT